MLDNLETDDRVEFAKLTREIIVGGSLGKPDFWIGLFCDANSSCRGIDSRDRIALLNEHRGSRAATAPEVHYCGIRFQMREKNFANRRPEIMV